MSAGIVDHETGTRDASRLGGLLWLMPITGTLALIAAASMAGLPLLNGFLSKEMMLEAAASTDYLGSPWLVPCLATLGALLSVAYSFRFVGAVFLGRPRDDYPSIRMIRRPACGCRWRCWSCRWSLIGVAPVLAEPLVDLAARAVVGGAAARLPPGALARPDARPVHDRGGDRRRRAPAGGLSARDGPAPGDAAARGEVDLRCRRSARCRRPRGRSRTRSTTARCSAACCSRSWSMLGVGATAFLGAPHAAGARPMLTPTLPALALWLLVAAAGLGVLRYHGHRLLALILTSVVGLVVSLTFVYFSAPDLALTQLSVEIVTTVLMLLALNYLPQTHPARAVACCARWRDAAIAAARRPRHRRHALRRADPRPRPDHRRPGTSPTSKPGGGGTNVVNVILVDFRGYDTFGEIIVLGIAALAIFALLDSALGGASGQRLSTLPHRREAGDRHPLMLVVVDPGAAAAGAHRRRVHPAARTQHAGRRLHRRARDRRRADHAVHGERLCLGRPAAADRLPRADRGRRARRRASPASAPGSADLPFLTSGYDHFHLPLVGEVELATAMAFDLGVFLTVVGVVMLTLANLARVGRKAEPQPAEAGPMDIVLRGRGALRWSSWSRAASASPRRSGSISSCGPRPSRWCWGSPSCPTPSTSTCSPWAGW